MYSDGIDRRHDNNRARGLGRPSHRSDTRRVLAALPAVPLALTACGGEGRAAAAALLKEVLARG